jgi:hypothetical protein
MPGQPAGRRARRRRGSGGRNARQPRRHPAPHAGARERPKLRLEGARRFAEDAARAYANAQSEKEFQAQTLVEEIDNTDAA